MPKSSRPSDARAHPAGRPARRVLRLRAFLLAGVAVIGVVAIAVLLVGQRDRPREPDRLLQPGAVGPGATARGPERPAEVSPISAPSATPAPSAPVDAPREPAAVEPPVAAVPQPTGLPPLPLASTPPARPYDIVREVYGFAAAHPEVLTYVPCYCGCEANGHRSNLDCFVAARDAEGRVSRWNTHGLG